MTITFNHIAKLGQIGREILEMAAVGRMALETIQVGEALRGIGQTSVEVDQLGVLGRDITAPLSTC